MPDMGCLHYKYWSKKCRFWRKKLLKTVKTRPSVKMLVLFVSKTWQVPVCASKPRPNQRNVKLPKRWSWKLMIRTKWNSDFGCWKWKNDCLRMEQSIISGQINPADFLNSVPTINASKLHFYCNYCNCVCARVVQWGLVWGACSR